MKRIVIALGGNALLRKGQKGTYQEQLENAKRTAKFLADVIEKGYEVVITHGNGPQVGAIMLQNEIAKEIVPPFPLDVANAETQALIGYMIQQSLKNELNARGIDKEIVTLITQVVVDEDDPAFNNPTKFIGPYYTEEEAKKLMQEKGWIIKPDPRGGWRRVVPSPDPKDIVEKNIIRDLVNQGFIVITAGGGGIPVVKTDHGYEGIEAVIDKDLASALVGKIVRADTLLILTDVEYVLLNYKKPNQKPIKQMSASEAEKYYREGHFPPGSMGPKVLACIRFVRWGGKKGIIGHLERATEALEGKTGTVILPD
ncbi:MAG: carbamate kinase [Thermoprotei archaeon]|nr:MAG: carbamate kinase [Thermoprotei archaeon]